MLIIPEMLIPEHQGGMRGRPDREGADYKGGSGLDPLITLASAEVEKKSERGGREGKLTLRIPRAMRQGNGTSRGFHRCKWENYLRHRAFPATLRLGAASGT